jgi:hypothetical protein
MFFVAGIGDPGKSILTALDRCRLKPAVNHLQPTLGVSDYQRAMSGKLFLPDGFQPPAIAGKNIWVYDSIIKHGNRNSHGIWE